MAMTPLEQFIDTVLRKQPLRSAPAGFEARVLQRLAQQAARPWWLQGFSRWPKSAQLLFLPLAVCFVPLLFRAAGSLTALLQSARYSASLSGAQSAAATVGSLGHAAQTLGELVMREIPAIWIYSGVGFAALLYAALFGLGAAFRTLVLAPQHAPN
jgi:hypothetical protein